MNTTLIFFLILVGITSLLFFLTYKKPGYVNPNVKLLDDFIGEEFGGKLPSTMFSITSKGRREYPITNVQLNSEFYSLLSQWLSKKESNHSILTISDYIYKHNLILWKYI